MVGEQFQISQERVRRIEHEALQTLRHLDGDIARRSDANGLPVMHPSR